jgi:hypothetical protein
MRAQRSTIRAPSERHADELRHHAKVDKKGLRCRLSAHSLRPRNAVAPCCRNHEPIPHLFVDHWVDGEETLAPWVVLAAD